MTGALLTGWMLDIANTAVTAGAGILVQSTLIITAGLALAFAVRKRGAATQSAVLRAFLVAVFLCMPSTLILQRVGVRGITFEIPLAPGHTAPAALPGNTPVKSPAAAPHPDRIPVGIPVHTVPAVSRPAVSSSGAVSSPAPKPEMASKSGARSSSVSPVKPNASRARVLHTFQVLLALSFSLFWAACTVFLLVRLLTHHFYLLSICRSAVIAKPSALAACRAAAQTLGVRPVHVLQSPSVHSPFLAGILRPRVFLPLGGVETVLEERSVFLHELAHLARRDTAWNLARQIAVALFPFQPLLWVLSSRIEEMSDYACDDYVTHATGMHRSYADSLIAIARRSIPDPREVTAGVGIISFKSPLRRRVERILDLSRTVTLRAGKRLLVLVSSFCLCITFLSGLIGFREKGFAAQAKKLSEAFSRGGKAVAFSVLPLVKQQVTASLQSPDEPDNREAAASRDEESPSDAHSGSAGEPLPDPAAFAVASAESPAESPSVPPLPAENAHIPDLTVAPEPVAIPSLAASTAEHPAPEKSTGNRSASGLFRAPVLTGSGYLSPDSGTNIGKVPTGQLSVMAKEQETYSGLKSNLDWGKQSPVWSPDGKTIAFTEYTGFGIWINPAGGGEPRLLYNNRGEWQYLDRRFGGGNMRTLCFTPDGRGITVVNYIFDLERGSHAEIRGSEVAYYGIVPMLQNIEIATGNRRILYIGASDGCWSPDGKILIAVTDPGDNKLLGQIIALDLVNNETWVLAESGACPCVTPDGSTVVFTDGRTLYRVPLAGGEPEKLPVEGCFWNPRCSPDGEWILGTGNRDGSAHTWLRAHNLKTGQTKDILSMASQNLEMGSWSSNGKQFCYTRSKPDGSGSSSIYIADFHPETAGSPASEEEPVPVPFKLIGNYPNPFNPSTTIEFSLPSSGRASLAIYNMAGQKVRELVMETLPAGNHSAVWNGRDSDGNPVSSGVYIARLKMEGKVESHRMTLVK